jgi:arylsulfatase A-like enzyme
MKLPQWALALAFLPGAAAAQNNVLMVIADDVGVDKIGAYAEGAQIPPTPNIDALAAGGVLFRNCSANPTSSTTRATILTGRYSFRTGVGYLVDGVILPDVPPLQLSEYILPEVLDLAQPGLYKHAAIGKWHLGNASVGGPQAPNMAGFQYHAGLLANMEGSDNYYSWQKTVQGVTSYTTKYITTDEVDEAINFIAGATGPWYCQVWFFASHAQKPA